MEWVIDCLGSLYMNYGKLGEAEEVYQRAQRGKEKALGPGHISTLSSVSNLGNIFRIQGKLDKAEKMSQRALQPGSA